MARYTGPVCKVCRREGEKLYLKANRCSTQKCALERRNYPAGEHGHRRRKISDYALQLREKQKLRRMYGVLEKQFRIYRDRASRQRGVTGGILLQFLERRLDNVVFRVGFCPSRPSARQMVTHGHFLVNGRKVNIPSYMVSADDVVEARTKESTKKWIEGMLGTADRRPVPEWLSVDFENYKVKVVRLPKREEIAVTVDESSVVELYSK
ncbi:30S ribosomal protein S4 [bacterium]|nr:30S ribosomal protein S4 [bacterium]